MFGPNGDLRVCHDHLPTFPLPFFGDESSMNDDFVGENDDDDASAGLISPDTLLQHHNVLGIMSRPCFATQAFHFHPLGDEFIPLSNTIEVSRVTFIVSGEPFSVLQVFSKSSSQSSFDMQ